MISLKGDTFSKIASINNLKEAHKLARRGKAHYRDVERINENPDKYLKKLQESLLDGTFTTSKYRIEEKEEGGKTRIIHKLPYYPDRIVQHAIVNICGDFWVSTMIKDTYQSIRGRGTHKAAKKIIKSIRLPENTHYIQLDITKFYPSIQNKYLLDDRVLRIKCKKTKALLKDIITSLPELPLGNHTSQYLGNLVLNDLDWYVKNELRVKHYFRYCDDILILGSDVTELQAITDKINTRLGLIELQLKEGYKAKKIEDIPVDILGYVIRKDKIRLRKRIADNFKNKIRMNLLESAISYYGWAVHTRSQNLFFKHVSPKQWLQVRRVV